MSTELAEDIIKFFGIVAGAVISIWKVSDSIEKVMINKAKQKSVGEEAIIKLTQDRDRLQKDFEALRNERQTDRKLLEKLESDFGILMDRVWKLLTK